MEVLGLLITPQLLAEVPRPSPLALRAELLVGEELLDRQPQFLRREPERVADLLTMMSPPASDAEIWLLVLAAFWVAVADGSFEMAERKEVARLCARQACSPRRC